MQAGDAVGEHGRIGHGSFTRHAYVARIGRPHGAHEPAWRQGRDATLGARRGPGSGAGLWTSYRTLWRMPSRLNRREFVRTGAAAAGLGLDLARRRRAGHPAGPGQAGRHRVGQRQHAHPRRHRDVRRARLPADDGRHRRPRGADRRRQHRRTRSQGHQRRLRRPAERRRRGATRLVLHARAEEAGRRRRRPRRRAHAVEGGVRGDAEHRPSPARRRRRAAFRQADGIPGRGRPQHRDVPASCGWNGSGGSIRSTSSIPTSAPMRRSTPAARWSAMA